MFQLLAIKQAPNKEVVSWGVPGRLDMSGKRVVPSCMLTSSCAGCRMSLAFLRVGFAPEIVTLAVLSLAGFHTSCPVGLGQLNNQEMVAQGCPAWYRASTGATVPYSQSMVRLCVCACLCV